MNPNEATRQALAALPLIPCAEGAPVFAEPWQAEAFAMTLSLHARGFFTWRDWADRLAATISAAQADGDPDRGDTYYGHWLSALEDVVVEKGLLDRATIEARHDAWDRAAHATPHGEPIELGRELQRSTNLLE